MAGSLRGGGARRDGGQPLKMARSSDPSSPFRMSVLNSILTPTAQKNREYKDNFVAQ